MPHEMTEWLFEFDFFIFCHKMHRSLFMSFSLKLSRALNQMETAPLLTD